MLAIFLLMSALAQAADGQSVPAAPAPAPIATPATATPDGAPKATTAHLSAGAPIIVELAEMISSDTSHLGDRFKIRLADPILVDGATVVAAGAMGEGEIIDVGRSGINGRQAKLVIAARFLDLNGRRVRIRGMSLMASGTSHVDLATGLALVPYAGLASFLVKGGEIAMPTGTRATARLAEDVDLPMPPSPDLKGNPQ